MAHLLDPTGTPSVLKKPTVFHTDISSRWLIAARLLWVLIVGLTLWVLVVNLPTYFAALGTLCTGSPCADYQLTPSTLRMLQPLGISLSRYAVSFFVLKCLAILPWFAVAVLIVWRKSTDWFALVVALFLVLLGTFQNIQVETILSGPHSLWWWLLSSLVLLTFALFFLVFALFPTGRFVPQWISWLFALWCLFLLSVAFFQGTPFDIYTWSEPLGNMVWFVLLGTTGVAQIYRYRRISDTIQRLQTKWVVYPVAVISLLFVVISLPFVLVPALNQPTSFLPFVWSHLIDMSALLIPCSFGMAILLYRLWDIDIIIKRTLVYGVLTASIVGLYILVVVFLGGLFHAGNNLVISLLATGLVAVLFSPLRELLQGGVNRLLYGQRDEPYRVISALGQRLEATLAPEAILSAIVETVAQALKLPYVAIALKQDEELAIAASYVSQKRGTYRGDTVLHSQDTLLHLPLLYQSEPVGELVLAPRTRGESLTPADHRLLADLARQVGVAAHAVRLTADLQESRERLVTAREEERRRLRRDLHDGLGPALASMTLKLDAARNLLTRDPSAADALLVNLKQQTQTSLADIRRLVYALRPPTLDELGLIQALREQAEQYHIDGLHMTIEAPEPLPPLPAAVEVAAYRIAQEAMTNVARHAQAHTCTIRFALDKGLDLEICDDGRGIPAGQRVGVGLTSIRERAAELAGRCEIEARPTGGTRLHIQLPLPKMMEQEE